MSCDPSCPDWYMQVISRALEVWLLTMTPITSPQMKGVLENPVWVSKIKCNHSNFIVAWSYFSAQQAFICNHDNHWVTVRKLGMQVCMDILCTQGWSIMSTSLSLPLLLFSSFSPPHLPLSFLNPFVTSPFLSLSITPAFLSSFQWFDLNSLHRKPELISDTYLSLFLTQLQLEGRPVYTYTWCSAFHVVFC